MVFVHGGLKSWLCGGLHVNIELLSVPFCKNITVPRKIKESKRDRYHTNIVVVRTF